MKENASSGWVVVAAAFTLMFVGFGAALWVASAANSLGVLYATYSIGLGLGVGLVYVPSIGAVQPWFGANRALASGLAVAGIGAGNFAGPLLAAWWIGLFGWRGAFLALALFAVVLGARRPSPSRRRSSARAESAKAFRWPAW